MKNIKFLGTGDPDYEGLICAPGTVPGEYTLCGNTLDCDVMTAGDWESTNRKINCSDCLEIIAHVKKNL